MQNFDNLSSKKGRLGRGVNSLFGDNAFDVEIETKKTMSPAGSVNSEELGERVLTLEVQKIKPNMAQPRRHFEAEKLKELANSIKEQGILQPITVRALKANGEYEIIAGERRWRAAQLAGLTEVPAIVKTVGDQKTLELALIENIQRADLGPLEEAAAYSKLSKEYNLTQSEIAQRVGKDRATVANTMRLLDLSSSVKTLLTEGGISVGHAKLLLAIQDHEKQLSVAKQIVEKKLNVRAAEKLIRDLLIPPTKKDGGVESEGPLSLDLSAKLANRLAEDLQKHLGTKVSIDYQNKKGKLIVHFYSDEELTNLVEKLKARK